LAAKLADLLSAASRALLTAKSEHAQLKALAPTGATAEAVRSYAARLSALLDSPEKKEEDKDKDGAVPTSSLPDVQNRLNTLYTDVTRADAAPTAAQLSASEAAQRAISGLLRTWQQVQADLPTLNERLRAHKLAQIRPDLPPPRDLNAADEE
jgi:hypothetical protein